MIVPAGVADVAGMLATAMNVVKRPTNGEGGAPALGVPTPGPGSTFQRPSS
jgi:hypothetical protein